MAPSHPHDAHSIPYSCPSENCPGSLVEVLVAMGDTIKLFYFMLAFPMTSPLRSKA
jgi:hypothetical protein